MTPTAGPLVNDVHSRLSSTRVAEIQRPTSADEVTEAVARARRSGRPIALCGGRHAMGAQPFKSGESLLDLTGLERVVSLDDARGVAQIQAGARWPAIVAGLHALQGATPRWGIAQKQTGADRLTLGGAIAANAHGRGLALQPLVGDLESIDVVDARGELVRASRAENADLFALAVGGYGLFGVVVSAELRLARRRVLRRSVDVVLANELVDAFTERIAAGALYGDFQFSIDGASPDFLRRGVLSCYTPVLGAPQIPSGQRALSPNHWKELLRLAHTAKSEAYRRYEEHYLGTHGQLYWSDGHQLGVYVEGYHEAIDAELNQRGSERIAELYLPRTELASFLAGAAATLRGEDVVYGTVRLIEREEDTVLAWARESWACVVLNLHTRHTPAGERRTRDAFRRLIDLALARGGSFYLTYGRDATRAQVQRAYPRFEEFAAAKRELDPTGVFASDWWTHYCPVARTPRVATARKTW